MQAANQAVIDPLLNQERVMEITGKGRTSIHVAMKLGEFPLPIKTGKRSVAWKSSDIMSWIESRPVASRGGAAND